MFYQIGQECEDINDTLTLIDIVMCGHVIDDFTHGLWIGDLVPDVRAYEIEPVVHAIRQIQEHHVAGQIAGQQIRRRHHARVKRQGGGYAEIRRHMHLGFGEVVTLG